MENIWTQGETVSVGGWKLLSEKLLNSAFTTNILKMINVNTEKWWGHEKRTEQTEVDTKFYSWNKKATGNAYA